MRKLLIHSRGEEGRWAEVRVCDPAFHPLVYQEPPELDMSRETRVQPMRRMPVERLSLIKYLSGVMILWRSGVVAEAVDMSEPLY